MFGYNKSIQLSLIIHWLSCLKKINCSFEFSIIDHNIKWWSKQEKLFIMYFVTITVLQDEPMVGTPFFRHNIN